MIVAKSDRGDLVRVKASDLSEEDAAQLGAIAGALVGLGPDVGRDDGDVAPTHGQAAEARGFLGDEGQARPARGPQGAASRPSKQ